MNTMQDEIDAMLLDLTLECARPSWRFRLLFGAQERQLIGFAINTFVAALRTVIDNVRTGSYESTGQAVDKAEKLLAERQEQAMASEVLSGCAVHAAIQQQRIDNDLHYLRAIRIRLVALYESTKAPNVREQISDEVDWVNSQLGDQE
jgi:hypothetical protein